MLKHFLDLLYETSIFPNVQIITPTRTRRIAQSQIINLSSTLLEGKSHKTFGSRAKGHKNMIYNMSFHFGA